MNMDFLLVICDLDNTLVGHGMGSAMTERTKEMIRRLYKHGVSFGIASGRPLDELQAYAGIWGLEKEINVFVCLNGSELWDGSTGQVFDYYKLKKEWMKEVIELLEPFDLNPYIYYHGAFLCKRDDFGVERSAQRAHKPVIVARDISELYQEDNAKIMFRVKEGQMEEVEHFLEEHPSPYYHGFKTQETLLEVANRKVSKAYAMERYCESHGIPLGQVLAFGDTSNDNDMLIAAGKGVCLINGSDDTRAIADDITALPSGEDGVAVYMEEHYFKPLGWM